MVFVLKNNGVSYDFLTIVCNSSDSQQIDASQAVLL